MCQDRGSCRVALVIVPDHDELVGVLCPLKKNGELKRGAVLGFVYEDDLWKPGGFVAIGKCDFEHVCVVYRGR